MKTKIKRHYRSVVSVLLSVCMLVSCMTVGLIATDAARVSGEESVGVSGTVYIEGDFGWSWVEMYQKDGNYYYSLDTLSNGCQWKFKYNNSEYGSTSTDESTRKIYNYGESNGKTVKSNSTSTFRNNIGSITTGVTIWLKGDLSKTWLTAGKTANPIDVTVSSVDNAVVSATQGSVTVNEGDTDKKFQKGSDATATITPDAGYVPETLTVGSNTYTLSDLTKSGSNYTYTFTVPETATGTFTISAVMKRQIANSASISASPATLSAEGASATVTVTPTTPATNNLKYTLYDDADNSVVDILTVTDGSAAAFTVTPTAKRTYYYAVLEENPNSGTYSTLTTDKVLITNTALREKYTVTFAANDSSKGTVTAVTDGGTTLTSGDKVFADTVVTFTAIPKTKCLFKKWEDNSTTTPRNVTITGDTTVTGNFAYDGYELLYNDTTITMKELDDGTYVSTSKVGYFSGNTLETSKRFTIKNLSNDKVAYADSSDTYWINDLNKKASVASWATNTDAAKNIAKTWVNHSGQSAYVGFDPYTEKVWLSDNPQLARDVKIIAKNGTIRYQYKDKSHSNELIDEGTTRSYGTTTITKKSGTVAGSVTNAYSDNAKELSITGPENGNGVTLTITTSNVKLGYYVKGWVVNGETYLCKDSSGNPITGTTSDGNYSFDYVVDKFPDTVNGRIEITPVYYSTRSNYVGFYVTGYEMAKSEWGNTLAIYSYKGSTPLDGNWPGQPMLKINGRYYAQIADDATGITLSNYVFDYVHNRTDKTMNLADNSTDKDKTIHQYQTYDFDDFKKIQTYKLAGQSNPEIVFSFKYKKGVWWNATNNSNDNFYKFSGMVNYNPDPAYPDNARINDFAGPWEDLTNYYGKKVDIFETELTDAQLSNSTYYVVSNGYIWNEVGQYATDWIIYENNSGSLVKKYRFCSESRRLEAINSNGNLTDSYVSLSYLQGHPIKITYEFSNLSGFHDGARSSNSVDTNPSSNSYQGQPSYRGDGRWTYTEQRKVKAHVIIEYADHARSTFTRDYFQPNNYDFTSGANYNPEPHTGRTTGTQAYFTDTSDPGKQTESEKWTKSNQYFNFKAEPDPEHEYTFIGWYLLDDGTYSLLDFNEDGTCSVRVDNNDVFVARFIKTPAGNVKLSHELMENSKNPDLGVTFNSAEIVDSSNNTVTTITGNPIATNNKGTTLIKSKYIKADYAAAGYKLKITLKTTPKTSPSAEFKSFYYDINKSDTQTKITGTGSLGGTAVNVDNINTSSTDKAATIYVPLSYFFDVHDGEYFFDVSKDTLKFYSELIVSSKSFTVTKKLADYTESDAFTIKVETSTDGTSWSNYANQAYTSTGTNGNTDGTGLASIHQNETLTFANIAVGTHVRITETATVKDYIFDSASAVKQNDSASPKRNISTPATNGCSFQITDDDVDVTINNKRQEYKWIIKFEYNSRLWSTQGYHADGTFTKAQLDTYTTYTQVTDNGTGKTVYGIKFKSPEERAAFVTQYLPHEDNFRQKVTWTAAEASENYFDDNKEISMGLTAGYDDAKKLTVKYQFPCQMNHTNAGSVAKEKDENGHARVYAGSESTLTCVNTVQYMNWYCLNNVILSNGVPTGEPIFVSAPESIIDATDGNKVKYFHHWSVKTADDTVEYTKCYNREYNYAFYQDSIVTPVYMEANQPFDHTAVSEEARSENPATITFLEASRNQWNKNQCGTAKNVWDASGRYSDYGDRIFVDFVLDLHYIENGKNLQLNTIPEAQRSNYHAGLLIQQLDELDKYTAGEHTGEYITDSTHYASKYANNDGTTEAMAALTGGTATKENSYYNSVISVADFDNKNELEYYYNFANISQGAPYRTCTAYKNYAFRAYTYLYVDDGQKIISAPVYFTMYDIASIENLYDIAQTKS